MNPAFGSADGACHDCLANKGKVMARQQPVRRKAQSKAPVSIPDKLYFRIGDVARLCSLPAYVLRFWETEFPQLKPNKGGTGQRLYRKRDVEMVLEIKRLLYDEGFTIAGARRLLTEKRRLAPGLASKPVEIGSGSELKSPSPSSGERRLSHSGEGIAAKKGSSKPSPRRPEISQLRKEMRELLTLLGPGPAEQKAVLAPGKREQKKARLRDEPTLF